MGVAGRPLLRILDSSNSRCSIAHLGDGKLNFREFLRTVSMSFFSSAADLYDSPTQVQTRVGVPAELLPCFEILPSRGTGCQCPAGRELQRDTDSGRSDAHCCTARHQRRPGAHTSRPDDRIVASSALSLALCCPFSTPSPSAGGSLGWRAGTSSSSTCFDATGTLPITMTVPAW